MERDFSVVTRRNVAVVCSTAAEPSGAKSSSATAAQVFGAADGGRQLLTQMIEYRIEHI